MQPPTAVNSTNNKAYITPEHRTRLGQAFNDLDDDQLRGLLTNYLPDSSIAHQSQHFTRKQLFEQCVHLIDNYYSTDLEQTIYIMRRKHVPSDFYLPQQSNFPMSFNQQSYPYNPPNYRFSSSPAITQQLRSSISNRKKNFIDSLMGFFYYFSSTEFKFISTNKFSTFTSSNISIFQSPTTNSTFTSSFYCSDIQQCIGIYYPTISSSNITSFFFSHCITFNQYFSTFTNQ